MKRFGQVLIVATGLSVLLSSNPLPATAGICKGNSAPCVTANDIKNDAVHPKHIKAVNSNDIVDGAIKTVDIKDNAITEAKLSQAVRDLLATITAQAETMTEMQATLLTQAIQITALQTDLAAVSLPACIQTAAVEGRTIDDVIFRGCNVHIQNGHTSAKTTTTNGVGNLIIGCNEDDDLDGESYDDHPRGRPAARSGSHNLVLGTEHSYSSYGGLVVGWANIISAPQASVTGGYENTATGWYSSVGGGGFNTASGAGTSVSGGFDNTASGGGASVSGGFDNTASGGSASVSGGHANTASGNRASVSGGKSNTASDDYSYLP